MLWFNHGKKTIAALCALWQLQSQVNGQPLRDPTQLYPDVPKHCQKPIEMGDLKDLNVINGWVAPCNGDALFMG